jgi:glycosyltransferase involved in cell wall biosynthesis
MSARPRLLFLCQTLPYPLDGGVWIRTYHVLRLLSQAFDVTALCFERMGVSGTRDRRDVREALAVLGRLGRVEAFPIPQTGDRSRFVRDHLRSLLQGEVYTRFLYESRPFRARLRELLATESFDLVHVDSMDLAGYLPELATLPIACVHHNVESALLRRRSRFEGGWLARRYFGLQASRMEAVERRWAPRVALNVMVSQEDLEELRSLAAGEGRYVVVPNGVDVEEFAPAPGAEQGVAYIGGTNWFPNLDALEFFGDQILPELRRQDFDQPIRWVGSASAEQRRAYRERFGIELTGYVEDVRPPMQDAFCHIVPLRAGGGTRLKILNSWAMGKPVVSTSIGCEGLDARDGDNILVRDEPKEFAEAILALEADPALRERIGAAARRTAVETYSWDVIGRDMNQSYLDLLRGA